MAMALRERTTEVAVLKAIGFGKPLVLFLVLAEAMLVAGTGRTCSGRRLQAALRRRRHLASSPAGSCRSSTSPGQTALLGLGVSLAIGFLSGFIPALSAARLSVINGLRKVV